MPDHFAVLHQPRRPWLDEATLKDVFHEATARQHPGVVRDAGDGAAMLNAAYAVLRDPAARVRHLLELEWPQSVPKAASFPPDFADVFGKIAGIRQRAAEIYRKEATAQSLLARALLVGERTACREDVEATLAILSAARSTIEQDLRELDAGWDRRDASTPGRLSGIQQQLTFLAKWQAQLSEDLFRLGS
jgi:hypothetical protein